MPNNLEMGVNPFESHELEEAEKVLLPGDLIWGTRISARNARSLFEHGIVSPQNLENPEVMFPTTNNLICLAIISKNPDMKLRYENANHYAPRSSDGTINFEYRGGRIGIVISKDSLMKEFPGQVLAVGDYFAHSWIKKYERIILPNFDIDEDKQTVFGIPIGIGTRPVFADEARFIPKDPSTGAIGTHHWKGIVIQPNFWNSLKGLDIEASNLKIPVFSPDLKLLAKEFGI